MKKTAFDKAMDAYATLSDRDGRILDSFMRQYPKVIRPGDAAVSRAYDRWLKIYNIGRDARAALDAENS